MIPYAHKYNLCKQVIKENFYEQDPSYANKNN